MRYENDMRELLGKTPILKLDNMGIQDRIKVFVKLECFNPSGGVKENRY